MDTLELEELEKEIKRLKKENAILAEKLISQHRTELKEKFKELRLDQKQIVYLCAIMEHLGFVEEQSAFLNKVESSGDFDLESFLIFDVLELKELMTYKEFTSINKGLKFALEGNYDNPPTMLTCKGKQFFCSECGGTLFTDSFNYAIGAPVKLCNCGTEYEYKKA